MGAGWWNISQPAGVPGTEAATAEDRFDEAAFAADVDAALADTGDPPLQGAGPAADAACSSAGISGGSAATAEEVKFLGIFNILKKLALNTSTAKKFYKSQIDEKMMLENKTKLISEKTRLKIIEKSLLDLGL